MPMKKIQHGVLKAFQEANQVSERRMENLYTILSIDSISNKKLSHAKKPARAASEKKAVA